MSRYGQTDKDRTYHGIQQGEGDNDQEWQPARLQVEQTQFGPTERQDAAVLRVLDEPDDGGFGWGYNGGGTSRAAALILADALDLADPDECGIAMTAYPQDETLVRLREDFCEDVLSQCCDEFRLRRGAVLRWVRGWYAQHQIADLPAALVALPPFDHDDE